MNNTTTDCTDKDLTGSRGQAAGRRVLNCQHALMFNKFNVGWALAQQQSVALQLRRNRALRALFGQGPTYSLEKS